MASQCAPISSAAWPARSSRPARPGMARSRPGVHAAHVRTQRIEELRRRQAPGLPLVGPRSSRPRGAAKAVTLSFFKAPEPGLPAKCPARLYSQRALRALCPQVSPAPQRLVLHVGTGTYGTALTCTPGQQARTSPVSASHRDSAPTVSAPNTAAELSSRPNRLRSECAQHTDSRGTTLRPSPVVALGAASLVTASLAAGLLSPEASAAGLLELAPEPANALSLPTWAIHVASVVEWIVAMALVWEYGGSPDRPGWRGLAWGMVPLLFSAMCACTWHFTYNAPSLDFLVVLQSLTTLIGNCTLCLAAYRIYKLSPRTK